MIKNEKNQKIKMFLYYVFIIINNELFIYIAN